MVISRLLAKYKWEIVLFILVIFLDLIYFSGISLQSPINVSDWGPFPVRGLSAVSNYFQIFSVNNSGGQVGTGATNYLEPSYIIAYISYYISNSSALSQLSFLVLISLSSTFGMMFLTRYFIKEKLYGVISGVTYSFAPIFIINQMGWGNPGGIWFYMIVPWFVLASFNVINRPTTWNYIFLSVISFLAGFLTDQGLFLVVVFFAIPIGLSGIVISRSRKINCCFYIAFIFIGLLFLVYIAYIPTHFFINSSASALTMNNSITSYLNSLPSFYQMIFIELPNFGYNLSNSPQFYGFVNQNLLYFESLVDIFLLLILFLSKNRISSDLFEVLFLIFVFPFVALEILRSPYGFTILKKFPYIFSIFPEYFEIPLAFVMSLSLVLLLRLSVDLYREKEENYVNLIKSYSKKPLIRISRNGSSVSVDINSKFIAIVLIVFVISSAIPLAISDIDSGGYVHVVDKASGIPYVPQDILNAGLALYHLRTSYHIPDARDLWEPVNNGAVMLSAIDYVDPNALIYPAENVLSFNKNSSFENSFAFQYYTLLSLVNGNKVNLANNLQQLGVGFVVVIKNYTLNSVSLQLGGSIYNGSLLVNGGRNIVCGSPLQFISLLNEQSNISEIDNNSQFAIFINDLYLGQVYNYPSVLIPSEQIAPQQVSWINSLPIWRGSVPILKGSLPNISIEPYNHTSSIEFNNLSLQNSNSGIGILSPTFLSTHAKNVSESASLQNQYISLNNETAMNLGNVTQNPAIFNYSGFNGDFLNFSGNTYIHFSQNYINSIENSISNSRNLTVNLWFNASSFPNETNGIYGYEEIVGTDNSRGFGINEISSPDYSLFGMMVSQNGSQPTVYHTVARQKWYMATLTWNGSEMLFYVNGNLTGEETINNIFWWPTLNIGSGSSFGYSNFKGVMSDVLISDEYINSSKIKTIFSAGPENYNYTVRGTLVFLPLNRETIQAPTISLVLPVNTKQVLIGYYGNIDLSFGHGSVLKHLTGYSNNYIIVNLTNADSKSLNILGTEGVGGVNYVIGIWGTNFSSLIKELTPEKVSYTVSSSGHYVFVSQTEWTFLANTFTIQLYLNEKGIILPSSNGLSFAFTANYDIIIKLNYQGISPQVYQIVGLVGYIAVACIFGVVSTTIKKNKRR
jgi:hypothetical protein